MVGTNTIVNLQDALDDLEKQMEKAKEKYETLYRRVTAIREAIDALN